MAMHMQMRSTPLMSRPTNVSLERGKVPAVTDETRTMFDSVNDELTKNLQTFMDNLPGLTAKFGRFLEATKSLNPKSRQRNSNGPVSPLLRCHPKDSGNLSEVDCGEAADSPKPVVDTHLTPEEILETAAAGAYVDMAAQFMKNFDGKVYSSADSLPPLPEDPHLLTNMNALTCEAYELRVILSGVCDWIEMQMPAIKLEDNRGVAVQEAVIRHLVHMRSAVQTVNERQRSYTDKVAEYASKYYKSPQSAKQWAAAVLLWNNDHWDQLERDWRELRQIGILAGRLMSLNMEKLITPRHSPINNGFNYM